MLSNVSFTDRQTRPNALTLASDDNSKVVYYIDATWHTADIED